MKLCSFWWEPATAWETPLYKGTPPDGEREWTPMGNSDSAHYPNPLPLRRPVDTDDEEEENDTMEVCEEV